MAAIMTRLAGANAVLVRAPSIGSSDSICADLLTAGPGRQNVLLVSFTGGAMDRLEGLDPAATANRGVVAVGDATAGVADPAVETRTVSSASDLTGVGIAIGKFLSEWDRPVAVCVDSLTALLQYVDLETAYEFVQTITGQLRAADARGHFHVDPEAHGDQAIAALTALFDATLSLAGSPTVRTRELAD